MTAAGPFECDGNDNLEIRGRVIETDGNGIEVRGNCDVALIDSRIVAEGVAVLVYNRGRVEIENSHVEGGGAAISVDNRGRVSYGSIEPVRSREAGKKLPIGGSPEASH